jgi:hypothetical protein
MFADQLLDDVGDGAHLEAGKARKFDAGYGLSKADELQDDVPVVVPCVFAGGELRGEKIDAPDAVRS